MDPAALAVVIKALLVHRASWGSKGALLDRLYGPYGQGKHHERRENVARLLGFGRPAVDEVVECALNRATLVGHGILNESGADVYRIPLPTCLERVTEPRAITVTVAWFSPVNTHHQAYRRAKLEAGTESDPLAVLGVERIPEQPTDASTGRGTIFHQRFKGEKAVPFIDDGHLRLRVWCREQAGKLDQEIRYGLAVTIEAENGIPIYDEIRVRLMQVIGITT